MWEWFWDLHRGRSAGTAGWMALNATEMMAWATLTGNLVTLQEWRMLRDMDQAFLAAASAGSKTGKDSLPEEGQGRDLSAAAFDAVFG